MTAMQNDGGKSVTLAEAMGWEYVKPYGTNSGPELGKLPAGGGFWCHMTKGLRRELPPNPFADAADDYAVLDWLRDFVDDTDDIVDALEQRSVFSIVDYEIGAYAYAAIAILQQQEK